MNWQQEEKNTHPEQGCWSAQQNKLLHEEKEEKK